MAHLVVAHLKATRAVAAYFWQPSAPMLLQLLSGMLLAACFQPGHSNGLQPAVFKKHQQHLGRAVLSAAPEVLAVPNACPGCITEVFVKRRALRGGEDVGHTVTCAQQAFVACTGSCGTTPIWEAKQHPGTAPSCSTCAVSCNIFGTGCQTCKGHCSACQRVSSQSQQPEIKKPLSLNINRLALASSGAFVLRAGRLLTSNDVHSAEASIHQGSSSSIEPGLSVNIDTEVPAGPECDAYREFMVQPNFHDIMTWASDWWCLNKESVVGHDFLTELVRVADTDGDGRVSCVEFNAAVDPSLIAVAPECDLKAMRKAELKAAIQQP